MLLLLITLVVAAQSQVQIKERYIEAADHLIYYFNYLSGKTEEDYAPAERLRLWEEAVSLFKQNPFWGSGPGIVYHDRLIKGARYIHPHNVFLEILAEFGIAGFSVFILFWAFITKRVLSISKHLSGSALLTFLCLPITLLFFFIYSMLHTELSTEYFKWYFAGIISGFNDNLNQSGTSSI